MADARVATTLRFPVDFRDRLEKESDASGRTMTHYIMVACETRWNKPTDRLSRVEIAQSETERAYIEKLLYLINSPVWNLLRENIDHFYDTAKRLDAPADRVVAATPEQAKDLLAVARLLEADRDDADKIRRIIGQSRNITSKRHKKRRTA